MAPGKGGEWKRRGTGPRNKVKAVDKVARGKKKGPGGRGSGAHSTRRSDVWGNRVGYCGGHNQLRDSGDKTSTFNGGQRRGMWEGNRLYQGEWGLYKGTWNPGNSKKKLIKTTPRERIAADVTAKGSEVGKKNKIEKKGEEKSKSWHAELICCKEGGLKESTQCAKRGNGNIKYSFYSRGKKVLGESVGARLLVRANVKRVLERFKKNHSSRGGSSTAMCGVWRDLPGAVRGGEGDLDNASISESRLETRVPWPLGEKENRGESG